MTQRPTLTLSQKGDKPRRPFRAPVWSHQLDLKDLKGKRIKLIFSDDTIVIGTLLEADQFTLKVKYGEGDAQVVFFKSALVGFAPFVGA
ncbi:LSm family protein [Magnetospirillum molischianum]|uniref:Uncharacterized protein n=1 Tax=Magnetospirillum molischianum DSM 120 TaxID=1150626 RepID=H8FY74_MAGML|nr:hypothetical protein [Magnetospirillum molischianum]CCG43312.1 hypothetical protein PHAMO_80103 [Magnetospirillum molischianum DSM 120]